MFDIWNESGLYSLWIILVTWFCKKMHNNNEKEESIQRL